MYYRSWIGWTLGGLVGIVCCMQFWATGCGPGKQLQPIDDEDEINRYLDATEEGRDLFRTDSLINSDPYVVPYDEGAVYRDFVDSVKRGIVRYTTPPNRAHDYGAYGLMRDAEWEVYDDFYVRTVRTSGDSISETSQMLRIVRYAYFLKLGDDNEPFTGWVLWGYNGGKAKSPASLLVSREDGQSAFRGDGWNFRSFEFIDSDTFHLVDSLGNPYDSIKREEAESRYAYIRLDAIANIGDDKSLVFRSGDNAKASFYELISAETDSGFHQQQMLRTDSSRYIDTLSLPSPNKRIWNIVLMREFRRFRIPNTFPPADTMEVDNYNWCVPYRVPH
jgi:hypothetical protein